MVGCGFCSARKQLLALTRIHLEMCPDVEVAVAEEEGLGEEWEGVNDFSKMLRKLERNLY